MSLITQINKAHDKLFEEEIPRIIISELKQEAYLISKRNTNYNILIKQEEQLANLLESHLKETTLIRVAYNQAISKKITVEQWISSLHQRIQKKYHQAFETLTKITQEQTPEFSEITATVCLYSNSKKTNIYLPVLFEEHQKQDIPGAIYTAVLTAIYSAQSKTKPPKDSSNLTILRTNNSCNTNKLISQVEYNLNRLNNEPYLTLSKTKVKFNKIILNYDQSKNSQKPGIFHPQEKSAIN